MKQVEERCGASDEHVDEMQRKHAELQVAENQSYHQLESINHRKIKEMSQSIFRVSSQISLNEELLRNSRLNERRSNRTDTNDEKVGCLHYLRPRSRYSRT